MTLTSLQALILPLMQAIVQVECFAVALAVVLAQTWREIAAKITLEHLAVTLKTLPDSVPSLDK